MTILDLGEPDEWPEPARSVVERMAEEVAAWPELTEGIDPDDDELADEEDAGFPACDLAITRPDYSDTAERRLRDALAGHHLLAYHATRFLPHEVEWVRAEGMSVLSPELVERRLRGAADHYPEVLTDEEAELLRRSGPLVWQGTKAGRLGLLWVVAPFAIFDEEAHGFRPLLRAWGGESIGWTDNDDAAAVVTRFTELATPAIVELAVAAEEVPATRDLWPTAVGRLLGLPNASTQWGLAVSLGPDRVLGVLHPEHPRWPDRLRP